MLIRHCFYAISFFDEFGIFSTLCSQQKGWFFFTCERWVFLNICDVHSLTSSNRSIFLCRFVSPLLILSFEKNQQQTTDSDVMRWDENLGNFVIGRWSNLFPLFLQSKTTTHHQMSRSDFFACHNIICLIPWKMSKYICYCKVQRPYNDNKVSPLLKLREFSISSKTIYDLFWFWNNTLDICYWK